jgi:hypothetical protein
MNLYYVLVRRGHDCFGKPTCTVYVKEADFFEQQGGLTRQWGRSWRPLMAMDIHHARAKAESL